MSIAIISKWRKRISSTSEESPIAMADKAALKEVFDQFDANHDGRISAEELEDALKRLGVPATRKECEKMVCAVDKKGKGKGMRFDEFCTWVSKHKQVLSTEVEMRDAFQMFDTDSDGVITREELRAGMHKLGIALNDDEVTAMMSEADINKDGRVNWEEFVCMWRKH